MTRGLGVRRRPGLATLSVAACALVGVLAGLARAEDDGVLPGPPPAATASVARGSFLPWTMGARSDAQRGLVYMQGGYDGADQGAIYQMVGEAQLFERLSLRAGGSYFGRGDTVRPEVGLRVDLLRQEQQGVDMAVLGVYEAKGFNAVRAVTARVALSRAFGETRLVSNLGYGFGLEEGERYGDFRLAGLRRVTERITLGLDGRLRVDLERNGDEPAGEPDWEVVGGPLIAYTLDRYVVSATAGYTAMKYRLVNGLHDGVMATLGVGAVF